MTEIVIKELPFTVSVLTEAGTQEFDETFEETITSSADVGRDGAGEPLTVRYQLLANVFQLPLFEPIFIKEYDVAKEEVTVKDVTANVLLTLLAVSVTVIVQSE